VPDDVAVVGFDDAPIASLALPPLTTIRQPIDIMTTAAANLLVHRLGNGNSKPEHIVCATTFVRRASA
jgi:DNA-binding LacI/PurR family transcriptional regulator